MEKHYKIVMIAIIFAASMTIWGISCKQPGSLLSNLPEYVKKTLDEETKEYICLNIFPPNSSGKVFCSYMTIDKHTEDDTLVQYLMVYAAEYYINNNDLKLGTAVLVPVVITTKKYLYGYQVIDFKNPLKYDEGSPEVDKMFPESISNKITSGEFNSNESVDKMRLDAKNQAIVYYNSHLKSH